MQPTTCDQARTRIVADGIPFTSFGVDDVPAEVERNKGSA
jgi:hypothetical protein